MSTLAERECTPCRKGDPSLDHDVAAQLLAELGNEWEIVDGHHLMKKYTFPDFRKALEFTNRIGAIAESQNHHPDICLGWGYATVTIWTHAVGGLSENDFILAAKIENGDR